MFRKLSSSFLVQFSRPTNRFKVAIRTVHIDKYVSLNAQQRESLFRHEGRYLYNEKEELATHYVPFDIEALQDVAIKAMGAQRCTKFAKLAEEIYRRTFHLEFDNGSECVAQLPYPFVGPSHLVTSSEVATLDFVSSVLDVPVPQVYAWSSQRERNTIGADFILMEKIKGVPLSQRWDEMKHSEYVALAERVHDLEKKLSSIRFSQIGSIYFREDVNQELQSRPLLVDYHDNVSEGQAEKYRIGPIVAKSWCSGPRSGILTNRGPWPDAKSYILAAADLAEAIIEDDRIRSKISFRHPLMHSDIAKHLEALDLYRKILPEAIPKAPEFLYPTLWHPSLFQDNILVSESGPVSLTGFKGWQFATTEPYYRQANLPWAFVYTGNSSYRIEPDAPTASTSYDVVSNIFEDGKGDLQSERRQTYYEAHCLYPDERRLAMHDYPCRDRMIILLSNALHCWSAGYLPLRQHLLELINNWELIAPDTSPPVEMSAAMCQEIEADTFEWEAHEVAMDKSGYVFGLDYYRSDGWIAEGLFEETLKELNSVKMKDMPYEAVMSDGSVEKRTMPWPFVDGGYSHFLT